MKDIIRQLVTTYGSNIIMEKRFVFLMDDLGAFRNTPNPIRRIFLDIIESGYSGRLLSYGCWDIRSISLCSQYIEQTGIKDQFAETVFQQLSLGLGWTLDANQKNHHTSKTPVESVNPNASLSQNTQSQSKPYQKPESAAQRLTRTAYDDSAFRRIIYFNVFVKGYGNSRELNFTFNIKGNNKNLYLFKYELIGTNGEVLECDSVHLRQQESALRTITEVGKGIDPNMIKKVRYDLSIKDPRNRANYQNGSNTLNNVYQVTDRTLTQISKWKEEFDMFGSRQSIFAFNVQIIHTNPKSLTFKFAICQFKTDQIYNFHYIIYDKTGNVLLRDNVIMRSGYGTVPTKTISDCASGIDISTIGKIEYYLT